MDSEFKPKLHSGGNTGCGNTDSSLLERQQARMKWQQQHTFFNENDHRLQNLFTSMPLAQPPQQQFSGVISNHPSSDAVKPDPGMHEGQPDFGGGAYGDQMGYGYMNQNTVLKMTVADQTFVQGSSASVSPKKRKADRGQSLQVVSEKEKRIKGCAEEGDSKITHQYSNSDKAGNCDNKSSNSSKEASANTSISKEKSKVSEVQKTDYIHVRARRGQATDSHSLAERARREKISERMKYLQDLVPGCNKITGKAGMLDEIINYVQSLQKQVEFLSMKLATVNPELDFNIDDVFMKEMFQSSTSEFPALGCSSETANSAYFQLNSLEQVVSCCGLDMGINSTEMALRRSISAPTSIPETFMDSSCFNQIQPTATWDAADLQNPYKMEFEQGTLIPFQSHQFTGSNEGSNLKMGM